jgi:GNAT superfamily N-acetyltransferase
MFFSHIDGAEVMLRRNAVMGITGGPTADFNIAIFGEDPDQRDVFDDFLARVRATRVPAVAMLAGSAGPQLGPIALANGLIEAGAAPLMARSADLAEVPASEFVCKRATEAREMAIFSDLAAAAFALDRGWVDRTFAAASLLDARGVAVHIAYLEGVPMSGVCSTASGSTVGIWTMCTPPEKQRRGAGRAVLAAAMQDHRQHGAETFYLIATEAGKPLYDSLGFQTVDELSIWLVGDSSQFSAG